MVNSETPAVADESVARGQWCTSCETRIKVGQPVLRHQWLVQVSYRHVRCPARKGTAKADDLTGQSALFGRGGGR